MLGPSWPKRPKRDRSGTPSVKRRKTRFRILRSVASLRGSPMIFSPFLSIPLFFVMLLLLEAGRRFKAWTGAERHDRKRGLCAVWTSAGLYLLRGHRPLR